MSAAPVIRVLAGPKAGAQALLPPHGRVTVGHEFWHDVVIRDASTKGCALEIQLGEDGVAQLSVLDGAAGLLGQSLGPGQGGVLPHYTPVVMGASALAYGEPGSARWDEATALAAAAMPAPANDARPAEPVPAGVAGMWARWRADREEKAVNWGAVTGIGIALLAAVAAGPAIDAIEAGIGQRGGAERLLRENGYPQLSVNEAPDGGLAITGLVPAAADRERLQGLLDQKGIRAVVDVTSGADLARAAADVARMNGVAADGVALPGGGVELRTPPLAANEQARIATIVRRDVAGLTLLRFRDDLPGAGGEPRTIADVTKRVSNVVTGDPAYIVTVDGARYFPGALMPSGHRLVSIQGRTVMLERGGAITQLVF